MTQLTVAISDERFQKLKDLASSLGQSPEQFASERLEEALAPQSQDFLAAARLLLLKNQELYRRLAQ